MDIIRLIVILAVIGFVVWLIEAYAPVDATFKRLIQFVAVLGALLLILRAFGIF